MDIPKWVWALLGLFVIITMAASWNESATSDEPGHLSAGYAKIRFGNFNFNREHPPLLNMWAALPQVFLPVKMQDSGDAWESNDSYELGQQFLMKDNVKKIDIMLFSSRFMIALLGALAGLVIFLWSRDLFGQKAAYAALLLWMFNPTVLAHSHYITTDIGATALILLTLYCFRNYLVHPTLDKVLRTGIALGLALLSKFSAVYLLPVLILYAATKFRDWKFLIRHLSLIGLIALFFLIAGYGFPLTELYDAQTKGAFADAAFGSPIIKAVVKPILLILPVPSDYWWGFTYVVENAKVRPSFLFGEYKADGWWYYFPAAFAIKEPLALVFPFIAAFMLVMYLLAKQFFSDRHGNADLLYIIIPMILFLLVFMATTINIGIRHILPIYPFVMILISRLTVIPNRIWQGALYIVVVWYVLAALIAFPHYTAYFNEAIGGPANGYRYLIDSNIDWGQDLKNLAIYINDNSVKDGYIAYWGVEKPSVRNIGWKPFDCASPKHGWFAVSVNRLVGFNPGDNKCLHWIREYEPVAKIGYSIFVYDIP